MRGRMKKFLPNEELRQNRLIYSFNEAKEEGLGEDPFGLVKKVLET
jgi:hypothetical protein